MQFKKTYGRPVWNKYYICEILSTSTRVWHRGSKNKKTNTADASVWNQ